MADGSSARSEVQDEVCDARLSDKATLDDGQMWPTAFALKDVTAADEARIGALVKRAAG